MLNIILYSKTGCPWGDEVRELLVSKNIEFTEKEMLGNPEFMSECVSVSGQSKCPTLNINGYILCDSDAKQVEEYLKTLGK